MFIRKAAFLPALAVAVALAGAGGLTALTAPNADAQAATAPAQVQPRPEHHFDPGRHIEGRIAFLKAELKITDAQAPAFARVADAMRANVKDMAQLHEQFRADSDKPKTAVESLEGRVKFGELRTQHEQRFLAAFKPLYDSLSDDQKKAADELLASHRHHHHG